MACKRNYDKKVKFEMKKNWIMTSLVFGIIGAIICCFLTRNLALSIASGCFLFIIVLWLNPERRFMKVFYLVLSLIVSLNRFFFEIMGEISGIFFKVGSNAATDIVTVSLIILAGICLILDYLERKGKLNGFFFSIKKNKVGDINGIVDAHKMY